MTMAEIESKVNTMYSLSRGDKDAMKKALGKLLEKFSKRSENLDIEVNF